MKVYHLVISIVLIILLNGCQSVSMEERAYKSAVQLINTNNYPQAIGVLSDLGNYKKSKQLVADIRYLINGSFIGAGYAQIAAIKSDGTLVHRGGYEDSLSTNNWSNIKAISTDGEYIEGLVEGGKLVSTYPFTAPDLQASTLPSSWQMASVIEQMPQLEHVSSFQSDYPRNVLAILDNGKVQVINPSLNEEDIAAIHTWNNIVQAETNGTLVIGLKADGSVVSVGERYERYEVINWKDVVAISISNQLIGLKEDGTVVTVGDNRFGEGNVEDWNQIIAVSTSGHHTIGLKSDGTVIAAGDNSYGQGNIEHWKDIVAIDTSVYYSLGLRSDGTLVLAGSNSNLGADAIDVTNISDVLVPTIDAEQNTVYAESY
jgi:hypothetical protein